MAQGTGGIQLVNKTTPAANVALTAARWVLAWRTQAVN